MILWTRGQKSHDTRRYVLLLLLFGSSSSYSTGVKLSGIFFFRHTYTLRKKRKGQQRYRYVCTNSKYICMLYWDVRICVMRELACIHFFADNKTAFYTYMWAWLCVCVCVCLAVCLSACTVFTVHIKMSTNCKSKTSYWKFNKFIFIWLCGTMRCDVHMCVRRTYYMCSVHHQHVFYS